MVTLNLYLFKGFLLIVRIMVSEVFDLFIVMLLVFKLDKIRQNSHKTHSIVLYMFDDKKNE